MENIFIISLLTTFLYCLVKIGIMKFVDKEMQPLKILVKDAVLVFITSMVATYAFYKMDGNISNMLNVITDTTTVPVGSGVTEIFTDVPAF